MVVGIMVIGAVAYSFNRPFQRPANRGALPKVSICDGFILQNLGCLQREISILNLWN
jgi:hypothetical protein